MLSNTITLPIDILNNGTAVNFDYSRYDEYQNRSVYISGNHSLVARDSISFFRSFPKPSGNFKGVMKTSFKITKDIQVSGVDGVANLTSPIIIEVKLSLPVGATTAQLIAERQKVIALLDDDSLMKGLNEQLMI